MAKKNDPLATVRHAELWGLREVWQTAPDGTRELANGKYRELYDSDVATTDWQELEPQTPHYLFVPHDPAMDEEYLGGWSIQQMFPLNSVGIVTARDALTVHFTREQAWEVVTEFAQLEAEEARQRFDIAEDVQDWKVSWAQKDIRDSGPTETLVEPLLYRPFDRRYTYFTGRSRGFICRPRADAMRHMLREGGLGLCWTRPMSPRFSFSVVASAGVADQCCVGNKSAGSGISYIGPLYIYPKASEEAGDMLELAEAKSDRERQPNLDGTFVSDFAGRLELEFIPEGRGDLKRSFGPEDVFHYMYAVFHSPAYRARYAEFLKIDFPRLPLTSDTDLMRGLCLVGERLKTLHLMEAQDPAPHVQVGFPVSGDNVVGKIAYKDGKVWINKTQCFDGVPERAWEFQVGGYQVCHKWLKDRKGLSLSYDDIGHYCYIVRALDETIDRMSEIDEVIETHGGWPIR